MISVWVIGLAETLGLLALSWQHLGFGGPVIAAAVMAVLFVTLTFLLELLPSDRSRLTALGSLTGASAFAISLSAAFFYGGAREVSGHSLSGITLAGLAVVWALIAAIPFAVRRPHADLTDVLVGFALASRGNRDRAPRGRARTGLRVGGRVGHAGAPGRADQAPQRHPRRCARSCRPRSTCCSRSWRRSMSFSRCRRQLPHIGAGSRAAGRSRSPQ